MMRLPRFRSSLAAALLLTACAATSPSATPSAASPRPPSPAHDAGASPTTPSAANAAADASSSHPAALEPEPNTAGCDDAPPSTLPKTAPACGRVVSHALTVLRVRETMAAKMRNKSDKQWLDNWLAEETKRQVGYCKSRPWPDTLRRCLLDARTSAAVHTCEEDDFARSPVRGCCERVAAHHVRLMSTELAAESKDAADMLAVIKEAHEEQLRRACANVYSAAERKCSLAARTTAELKACTAGRAPP